MDNLKNYKTMTALQINPKYKEYYRVRADADFKALLNSNLIEEFKLKNKITMYLPKIYNDTYGFALGQFKDKIIFSKAIFVAESEENIKSLLTDVYWLGFDYNLKKKETERLAFNYEKSV